MDGVRLTIVVDSKIHADFKTVVAFKKTTMSTLVNKYIKEVVEGEREVLNVLNKKSKIKRKTK